MVTPDFQSMILLRSPQRFPNPKVRAIERPSQRWNEDKQAAQQSLSAAISLLLNLVGRDSDPVRSREHVLLSVLAQRRLSSRQPADIAALIHDLLEPPLLEIGALPIDAFVSSAQRGAIAAALYSLLVAPSFESWRTGASLDVGAWLTPRHGRTPGVPVSLTWKRKSGAWYSAYCWTKCSAGCAP